MSASRLNETGSIVAQTESIPNFFNFSALAMSSCRCSGLVDKCSTSQLRINFQGRHPTSYNAKWHVEFRECRGHIIYTEIIGIDTFTLS